MCDPTALLVMQGATALSGSVGSIFEASGMRSGLRAQARIADINAQAMDDQARWARERGQREEQKLRLAAAQLKSRQRATMGANNVDMSQGSALNTLASTDFMTESDAITIQQNTAREAQGYRTQASNQRMDAIMKRGQARGISPLLSGAQSLAAGAGKVAASWYSLGKTGAFAGEGSGSAGLTESDWGDLSPDLGRARTMPLQLPRGGTLQLPDYLVLN